MNLIALLCKFLILVRDLELADKHTRVQLLKFDTAKLFTRTFLSWELKKRFNLISALSWFGGSSQIRFICCSKFGLLSISRCDFDFSGASFKGFICIVLFSLIYDYGLNLSWVYNHFVFIKPIHGSFTFKF